MIVFMVEGIGIGDLSFAFLVVAFLMIMSAFTPHGESFCFSIAWALEEHLPWDARPSLFFLTLGDF